MPDTRSRTAARPAGPTGARSAVYPMRSTPVAGTAVGTCPTTNPAVSARRRPVEELHELLAWSAAGDTDAFADFYDATASRVHGLCRRVLRNTALAEEVTQEVYLEAWRTASRFDPERGTASAWLMTMAHRRAVDRVRSAAASARRDQTWSVSHTTPDHDVTSEAATAQLEAARVRAALDHLTENQRRALELAYFGGYTHREVATLLDLPIGTAKTRIRDGLIRLRDKLGVNPR